MSDLLDNAFEVTSMVIVDDEGTSLFGTFAGGILPHVAVPDAPFCSMYYRSNGDVYKLMGNNGAMASNWIDQKIDKEYVLPYFNSNGSQDNIDLVEVLMGYELPYFNSDGSQDNILVMEI
jgi:hypothetical protein